MSTPTLTVLDQHGVQYSLHDYEVAERVGQGYGPAVAAAIGVHADRVFKTLLAMVDDEPVVAIVPVDERLSTKALARVAGGKRAVMADPAEAERLTGYVTGGISPLGQRHHQRTFLDSSSLAHETIYISAGKRGLQVELAPSDLLAVTGGVVGELL